MQPNDIIILIQKNLKQMPSHLPIAGQLTSRWARGDAECLALWQCGGGMAVPWLWEGRGPRDPPRCLAAGLPTGPAPLAPEQGPEPAPAGCSETVQASGASASMGRSPPGDVVGTGRRRHDGHAALCPSLAGTCCSPGPGDGGPEPQQCQSCHPEGLLAPALFCPISGRCRRGARQGLRTSEADGKGLGGPRASCKGFVATLRLQGKDDRPSLELRKSATSGACGL